MKTFSMLTLGAVMGAVMIAAPLAAASADEAAIKYRKASMRILGGHMGSMAAIAKKQVPHAAHFSVHAKGLAETAALMGDLFPEGSGDGETEALPAIWSDPEGFKKAVDMMRDSSAKLAEATASGDQDAVMAAFGAVGKSCKGCHDNFRKKK